MDDQQARDEIDTELLRQLREGDLSRAWAAIENQYGAMMLATANAKLGFGKIDLGSGAVGGRSAHDVVQQVVVELMNHGPQLADRIKGPLGAYLRGAVRNRVKTAFDKGQGEITLDDDVLLQRGDLADIADRVVDNQIVEEALQPLDPRDRYVIEETVMHRRSNAAVGWELDLSGQGVGKIRARVLGKMAERMGGETP